MKKSHRISKHETLAEAVESQDEILHLNKFVVKHYLIDHQKNLGLNQYDFCVLNYLINISRVRDWMGTYPIVFLILKRLVLLCMANLQK